MLTNKWKFCVIYGNNNTRYFNLTLCIMALHILYIEKIHVAFTVDFNGLFNLLLHNTVVNINFF